MHADELPIDTGLVRRLLTEQFPRLADLPLTRFRSVGTVNAIYRLGDDLYVRLPRTVASSRDLVRECAWLPWLAPRLPLRIPEPVAAGSPTDGYPCSWGIFRWLDGQPYADERVRNEADAALALAHFVRELRNIEPTANVEPAGRRPLSELDEATRTAIDEAGSLIDGPAAKGAWREALDAPVWTDVPVWIHTDLLRPNLLVHEGRLAAVIDFGGAGAGDPAADVIAAWSVFGPVGRVAYRRELAVDDGVWARARGYALHQAALIIPYYRESNPDFVALAVRTVREVLADR